MRLFKSLDNSIKDIDSTKKIVTGYLSAFNNKDFDNDIIVKGAYSKSISERQKDIFFLNQHDWKQPHGKFQTLKEDEKGLYFESMPLINTTYSADAFKLYEAGIVKEHSVGYQVVKQEFSKSDDANMIKEIKLYEGSNVTLGANSDTPFTGFKSLTIKEVNDHHKLILKAFRNGTFTDETFGLLEIALKELQYKSYELGKKSLEDKKPLNDTSTIIKPIDNTKEIFNEFIKKL